MAYVVSVDSGKVYLVLWEEFGFFLPRTSPTSYGVSLFPSDEESILLDERVGSDSVPLTWCWVRVEDLLIVKAPDDDKMRIVCCAWNDR